MNEIKKFAVIGGDMRLYYLSRELIEMGYDVTECGFDHIESAVRCCIDVREVAARADAIILPLPASIDGINVNAPFSYINIPIAEIFSAVKKEQYIFGGQISKEVKSMARMNNLKIFDYFEREELIVRNAVPTAEGAIQIAMEQLPSTINGSKCLITGYGRIAKVLIKMLNGMGAHLIVAARKPWDLAWISSLGYEAVHISDLTNFVGNADIIFNTIPVKVIDQKIISRMNPNCFIIDLASKPGGVDYDAAEKAGIKLKWALSLPGKVAPLTAGRIIKDTIFNIIKEENICQN